MRNIESITEWERERARLSHDLLKNEIMPTVSKVLNILDGKVEDPEFKRTFCDLVGPRALHLCSGIEKLAGCADS